MRLLLLAIVQLFSFASCSSSSTTSKPNFTAEDLSHEVVIFDERTTAKAASPLNRHLLGLSIEFVLHLTTL